MTAVLLAGEPVLANAPTGWSLTTGTRAYATGFEFAKQKAARFAARETVELQIGESRFQGLHVTKVEAGSTPFTAVVVVADRRWYWPRAFVSRSYNVRRRTGDTRLVGEGLIETFQVADDVAYAPWSLNNGIRRWTIAEMARDVFAAVGVESVSLPEGFGRGLDSVFQDAIFEHPGDAAIEYMLEAAGGGYTVTVDPSGQVVVVDLAKRDELAIMQAAGPVVANAGFAATVDRRRTRPSKVVGLLTREVELRFDFEEGAQSQTTSKQSAGTSPRNQGVTQDAGRPPRDMVNVIPVVEPQFATSTRTVAIGQYLDVEEYLTGLDGEQRAGVPRLTLEELRRYFHSPSWLSHRYAVDDAGSDDLLWRRRLQTILQHWRITFRLNPAWRARLKSLRAVRVSLLDPESGTRAPATAYAPYLRKPTIHGLYKTQGQVPQGMGWRLGKYATNLSDAEQAPVTVRVVDEETGIIEVLPVLDPYGFSEAMVPGEVTDAPVWSGGAGPLLVWHMASLADGFKIAVVLTGVQGAPNNETRLEAIEVKAGDVGAGVSLGPPQYVRIDPGLLTARYRWDDDQADAIDGAFAGSGEYPKDLLINRDELEGVVKGVARSIYARTADRAEGRYPVPLNGRLVCRGSIASIDHQVSPDGVALSFVTAPPTVNVPSFWAYVPPAIQAVLRRVAQP